MENNEVTPKEEVVEVFPDPSCKACYGRGFIKRVTLPCKDKSKEKTVLDRCGCLGKGNQERARKAYLKLVGEEHSRGFKIQTKPS